MKLMFSIDFGFLSMLGDGDLLERKKPGDGQAFHQGGWIMLGLNDREYTEDR